MEMKEKDLKEEMEFLFGNEKELDKAMELLFGKEWKDMAEGDLSVLLKERRELISNFEKMVKQKDEE
jgi:hypothetical protein